MEKGIYVVVVTYNGASWIRLCLDSVQTGPRPPTVVVVDNASSDETASIVEKNYPQVRLIKSSKNLGFGIGNNLGIAFAINEGADYILLLNQDAYLPSGALAGMVEFMQRHPEIGVCSPLHCSPDIDNIDKRTFFNYLSIPSLPYVTDAVLGRPAEFYELRGVNAAIWLVRPDAFLSAGGFDPAFFMYGEDDDLLNRFEHHGVRFALVPGIRGVHLRQSPPAPPAGWAVSFRRLVRREQAKLICYVKRPGNSSFHAFALLLTHGFLRPTVVFLLDRRIQDVLVSFAASAAVLASWRTMTSHRRLCETTGPHFLDVTHEQRQV
jgi:GT2 family glycosyltransferase